MSLFTMAIIGVLVAALILIGFMHLLLDIRPNDAARVPYVHPPRPPVHQPVPSQPLPTQKRKPLK